MMLPVMMILPSSIEGLYVLNFAVRAYFLVSGCTGGWVQCISLSLSLSIERCLHKDMIVASSRIKLDGKLRQRARTPW
jgi:hypothetical protein